MTAVQTEPGYIWIPQDATLGDSSAADLMAEAGMPLLDWQKFVLSVLTARRPDGKWAGREVGLVVPRQNGKSVILAALALHGLIITDEPLQLWSAHQFRTAQESFQLLTQLFDSSAALRRRLRAVRASHGEERIVMKTGARLQFIARIRTSGRGFSADRMLLDEAMELGSEQVSSLLPTMAARFNPQAVYAASAGLVSTDHLRRVRDRGRAGGERTLAWVEYCARPRPGMTDDDVKRLGFSAFDLANRAEWHRANPSMGQLLGEDHIEMEFSSMPSEDFARERLGVWTEPPGEEAVERPFTPEQWENAVTTRRPGATARRVLAVDVAPKSASASVVAAFSLGDGSVYLSIGANRPGVGWVPGFVRDIVQRRNVDAVLIDGVGASGALAPAIREEIGGTVKVLNTKEVIEYSAAFATGVIDKRVLRGDDPTFTQAFAGARVRAIGDTGWGWRRSDSEGDITSIVAATFAAGKALEFARKEDVYEDSDSSEFG